MEATPALPSESKPRFDIRNLGPFFAVLGLLALLDTSLNFIALPLKQAAWASLALSVITVGAPIYALFLASKANWTAKMAGTVFGVGIVIHLGLQLASSHIPIHSKLGLLGIALLANLSQIGLLTWCLALGALISTLLKDRNMILPIAIFLAAFDAFLVLTPIGFTHKLLTAHPEIMHHIAYQVPMIPTKLRLSPVVPFARIGPADFLFLGMFFIDLNKYGMKAGRTFLWIAPTLVGYLLFVSIFGSIKIGPLSLNALPALLPIGLVVILVNRHEWKLSPDEKRSTLIICIAALALLSFGFWKLSKVPKAVHAPPLISPGQKATAKKPALKHSD